jgi:hypothetical protein
MADRLKTPSGGGVGTERRPDEGRGVGQDRRQADGLPGRREMRYGVLLSTARTVASIEAWLEPKCQGDWTIILDEIDEDNLLKKRLRILFELESDKLAFIAGFRR